jgi:nucleoside-diphosphate-sugar epimerase
MRVLIVGGTSPVARAVAARLRSAGHEVVTAGRRESDIRIDVEKQEEPPPGIARVDAVVGVVGAVGDRSIVGLRRAASVNSQGPLVTALLASAAQARHIVWLSTAYVHDPTAYAGPLCYPVTKRHGEELMAHAAELAGIDLAVLRPSHVYGSDPALLERQPVVRLALELSRRGEEFVLHGSHETRRDYIHVDDLVSMVVGALERRAVGTWDCASPEETTLRRVVETTYRARGLEPRIRVDESRNDVADSPPLDRDRAERALGVRAHTTFERGISAVIACEEAP